MLEEKVSKKQNWGSPCLFLKYAKQKANLKAICYVFVAIATNSAVLKITEFKLEILIYLSQPESVKLNLNTQNLRVSNCRTPKLLKTVSSHLNQPCLLKYVNLCDTYLYELVVFLLVTNA